MTKLARTDRFIVVILFVVTALLYARTVSFPFIDFDDHKYITENQHLKLGFSAASVHWALTTGYFANWHPVTWLSYLVTYSLFGGHAGPFHAVNVIFQSLNACLLFYFLKQTTGRRWPAFVAAAIWAWHPLRVESIAWVSETKDMLSVFFWMLTLIAYARYVRTPGNKWYLLVSLALLLALASKSSVVALPAVLLLMDYWPLCRQTPQNGDANRWRIQWLLLEKIPWLLMAVAVSVVVYHVQGSARSLELMQVIPLSIRLENAPVSVVQYIVASFWPTHLAIFYPHSALIGRSISIWQWAGSLMIVAAITICTAAFRRTRPFLWIGWLWFLGTLVPMIGIIQAGAQARADRYTLIPSIGLTIAVVWEFATVFRHRPFLRMAPAVFTAIILCISLAMSWRQIGFWRDTQSLFTHADAVVADNYLARSVLADKLQESGHDFDRALDLAQSAVNIYPDRPYSHDVLGCVLEKRGDEAGALAEFLTAENLDRQDGKVRNDLGGALLRMGRDQDALEQFKAAVRLDRNLADARNNLAVLLASTGNLDDAIVQWRQAIWLKPDEGVYHGLLAEALQLHGDRAQAIQQYTAAIAAGVHRPNWESSLAWFVATDPNSSTHEVRKIVPIAQDACEQTHGQDPLALDALAAALARCGRFDDAVIAAQRAVQCAQSAGKTALANSIENRLNLYRSGMAYVSPREE